MTYQQLIDRLKLNQSAAARFLGISDRSSRRYAAIERPAPTPIGLLLSLMIKRKISPEEVRKAAEQLDVLD